MRAVSDNLATRNLHYKLLLKTRENSPKVSVKMCNICYTVANNFAPDSISCSASVTSTHIINERRVLISVARSSAFFG